jgi:hypothetical protein
LSANTRAAEKFLPASDFKTNAATFRIPQIEARAMLSGAQKPALPKVMAVATIPKMQLAISNFLETAICVRATVQALTQCSDEISSAVTSWQSARPLDASNADGYLSHGAIATDKLY